eukprot:CAMPEP_0113466106 /NCGR_PEP_ID=MMETSP0014_2-20120614/14095_1 /TAXON_ID=2857 /ORGANISM="Nitzschia sp." /LENGTH=868 /DNA_ID=CAMNT_0000358307 /DNA_START=90 /DNA_END=2696 /DNA_ORIENTATION=+ /assembly_acc=CAM_ASM_000159
MPYCLLLVVVGLLGILPCSYSYYAVSAFTTVPTITTTSSPTKPAATFSYSTTSAAGGKTPRLLPAEFRLGYIDEKHDWKNENVVGPPESSSPPTVATVDDIAVTVPVQAHQTTVGAVQITTTPRGIPDAAANFGIQQLESNHPDEYESEYDESNNSFVYGANSRSYRGLTRPTKAGTVLATMLSFGIIMGMIVSSSSSSSQSLVDVSSIATATQQFVDLATVALSSAFSTAQTSTSTTTVVADLSQWIHNTVPTNLQDLDLEVLLPKFSIGIGSVIDLVPVERIDDVVQQQVQTMSHNIDASLRSITQQTTFLKERSIGQFADLEQLGRTSIGVMTDRVQTFTDDATSKGQMFLDQTVSQWSTASLQFQNDAKSVVENVETTTANQIIDLKQRIDSQQEIWMNDVVDLSSQVQDRFDVVSRQANDILTTKFDEYKSIGISAFDHGMEEFTAGVAVVDEQMKDYSAKSSVWISDTYNDLEHSAVLQGDQLRAQLQDEYSLAATKSEHWLSQAYDFTVEQFKCLKESSFKWTLETTADLQRWGDIQIDQASTTLQNDYLLLSDWTQKVEAETIDTSTQGIQNLKHLTEQEMKYVSQEFSTRYHQVDYQTRELSKEGQKVAFDQYNDMLVKAEDYIGFASQKLAELSCQVESQSRDLAAQGKELALTKYNELVEISKLESDRVLTFIDSVVSELRELAKEGESMALEKYSDLLQASQVEMDRVILDLKTAYNTLNADVLSGVAAMKTAAAQTFEEVRSETQHQYLVQTKMLTERLEIEKQALSLHLSNLQFVLESQISTCEVELLSFVSRISEALARMLYEYAASLSSYAEGLASSAGIQTSGSLSTDTSSATGVAKESLFLKSVLETLVN